jgi:hypothetical protein
VTLGDVVEEAAAELDLDGTTTADGATDYERDGVVFASVDPAGTTAIFRLDRVLASAALRTPDTQPSDRGDVWVAFAPVEVDDHAVDRAQAWFVAAHRRAVA